MLIDRSTIAVLAIAGLAAGAAAQPVIDGSLAGDESFYGDILWVQNQPTSFGDNHPSNIPPSGNPEVVTTGVEFAIPMSALGNPASIGLAGFVNSGDHTFSSNQHIGGLPNLGNLGSTSTLDLSAIDGDQFIAFTPGTGPDAPDVDGMLESAIYGAPLFLQNNFTGFGDATHGNVDEGSGSEIDGVYAVVVDDVLYLFITGNLEANNNALELFFDTVDGGENTLSGDPGGLDNDALDAMAGLTFDEGFEADYYLNVSGENVAGKGDPAEYELESYFGVLGTNDGFFLGAGGYGSDGTLTGGDGGAPDVSVTINNSNVEGVNDAPSIDIPSPDFAVGSEIDGVYAYVDQSGGRLYVLVTGNMESNYNKLNFFFDSVAGGQNPLRGDNVDIAFNGLNRMGENGNGDDTPGLTFDEEFVPDYWLDFNTGGLPIEQYHDAALLRTDGPAKNINGLPLDYGCYYGGAKADNNPLLFDGPLIDAQDGFTPDIYSNFAPRTSYEALEQAIADDPFDPQPINFVVAEQVIGTIDNSNIRGVTDSTVDGAAEVTTGIEFSIALNELGVGEGETGEIKLGGFITGGGFDFVSNQVIGGLPGSDNLGEVTVVDFSQIAGDQFVVIPLDGGCPADCDGNGVLNILDFVCFQTEWQNQTPFGDCDGNGEYNILDFVCYQGAFQAGCP